MYTGNNTYNSYANHGGYSGFSNSMPTATNISYDTNSKDPLLLRARVFVGNLNPKMGREEIIQLFRTYGTLLGVTVFKGYAFVQFSHGNEADLSVSTLNGHNWNGNVLDVKLAVSGQVAQAQHQQKPTSHIVPNAATNSKGMGKRNQNQFFQSLPAKEQKRFKVESDQDKSNNKAIATNLNNSELINLQHHTSYDTMICGNCRYTTINLANFIEHRKQPCKSFKADGEPDMLYCGHCNEEFSTSWSLLAHLNSVHNLTTLFKPFFYSKAGENGANHNLDGTTDGQQKFGGISEVVDVSMEQK